LSERSGAVVAPQSKPAEHAVVGEMPAERAA
jgi:hypothetical protein